MVVLTSCAVRALTGAQSLHAPRWKISRVVAVNVPLSWVAPSWVASAAAPRSSWRRRRGGITHFQAAGVFPHVHVPVAKFGPLQHTSVVAMPAFCSFLHLRVVPTTLSLSVVTPSQAAEGRVS